LNPNPQLQTAPLSVHIDDLSSRPDASTEQPWSSGEAFGAFASRYMLKNLGVAARLSVRTPGEAPSLQTAGGVFINTVPSNDLRPINEVFRALNKSLGIGSVYVGRVKTIGHRREEILRRAPWGTRRLLLFIDFWVNRVFPRLPVVRSVLGKFTHGPHRGLSLTETLGRLVYCGFQILEIEQAENETYFAALVKQAPHARRMHSLGPFFTMTREGRGGKQIRIHKFRTMHPYAEYLQGWMHDRRGLINGDKFQGDFRVTKWGGVMRRTWLDELPMVYNWLRGDVKLVGVRPLSSHKLSLYPHRVRALRRRHKPGLVPPFYADLPESFSELVESEARYLQTYERHPKRTDLKYLFRAAYNIVIRGVRSS
jgi:lipopolysaccharide/colanic/teichoic acid biosynthesis glycosyltransferase